MTIGERLKKEREKKGYSLDEVHSRLRIHPSILSQIEGGRFDELPAPIYAKGFIKRYSEFLELNAQEILVEYDSVSGRKRPPLEVPVPSREANAASQALLRNGSKRVETRPVLLRIAALGVTIAVVWILVGTLWSVGSHRPRVDPPKPPVSEARPAPAVSAAAAAPERASNWINTPELGNFPKLRAKDPLALKISASTEAWTRVASDGNTVFEAILRPGQSKEWTASKSFEIKTGRPAGISLVVNGTGLGSPGAGQATHVRITRDGVERLR